MSRDDMLSMRADYEKKYIKFKTYPHLSTKHVDLKVDFYPEERDAILKVVLDVIGTS